MSGWGPVVGGRKWHWYQDDGRALCGSAFFMGRQANLETGNDNSPDNCAECRHRKSKRTADQPEGKTK